MKTFAKFREEVLEKITYIRTRRETMNHDEMINYLLEKGKITPEDIEEALLKSFTLQKKEEVESLHLNHCKLDHGTEECRWYEEENNFVGGPLLWDQPTHKKWKDLFLNFLSSANLIQLVPEVIAEESSSTPYDSSPLSEGVDIT